MKKFKNIVVIAGTYKDREGQEKKRYQTIGSVFLKMTTTYLKIKIDSIPISQRRLEGWANCYDIGRKKHTKPPKSVLKICPTTYPFEEQPCCILESETPTL
jgi:hypothetical protein